jgi:phosphoglycolate phosphatase
MSITNEELRAILFDLDGTLVDSEEGITSSILHALWRAGQETPSAAELRSCIGPPLAVSLARLLPQLSSEQLTAVLRDYREHFASKGFSQCRPYAEIPKTLSVLRDRGYVCVVTTGKIFNFARMTLEHCNLSSFFNDVFAADDRASNKKEVVARAVSTLGLGPTRGLLVGDRIDDIEAAHASGIRCIAVSYGFGSMEELMWGDAIAATPHDIPALLEQLLP